MAQHLHDVHCLKAPFMSKGNTVVWDGRDAQGQALASGVYLYRLQAGTEVQTRKLVLVR